ncbi:transglycosylase domain-containing protein [Microterricola viridarii]|uniref:transglycosylase domain-containing protein n=1 Tax=Microterricola viridarii TaxID=412690 RepID=UPI0009F53AAF|nr:transglycosylase domain-containing protein [Microterricola viridarii]
MADDDRTFLGATGGLIGFVAVSAIAAVLIAAAMTPAVAIAGLAANSTIDVFEAIPDSLSIGELAEGSNIYATNADGSYHKLATFYEQNREEAGWEDISQFVKDAAVAVEDPRFWEHGGVDLQGTVRAVALTLMDDDNMQGGSSLTQQYVKNVLVQNAVMAASTPEEQEAAVAAAIETTPYRKLKEMRMAIALEKRYSKAEILRGYLNIAHFGGTVYGIEAASKYFFGGVSAMDLTLEQAASLIAIVNNPEKFRLDRPESEKNGEANGYAANTLRRDHILGKMLEHGKITAAQFDTAVATAVSPVVTSPNTGCQAAGGSGFFCDYVYWTIRNDDAFGATPDERIEKLRRGGLEIYTTLDLPLQVTAEAALNENVPSVDPRFDVGATAVTVQPNTGRVLSMVQNKTFSNDPEVLEANGPGWTSVNYNTDIDYGGSSGFQPGSTYKVFTLAEWLNAGHSLRENFDGRKRSFSRWINSCTGNFTAAFNPRNDDGRIASDAVNATKWSVNTSYMAMASQLDLCKLQQTIEAFDIHRADGDPLQMNPSDVLGTQEVAPITMAAAFAGIANGGLTCSPIVIDRILDRSGAELEPPKSTCRQSVEPSVAAAMAYAMRQTFSGDGTAVASNTGSGVPHIGKTGTTDDAKDTWMIGSSTTAATAVWVGNVIYDANLRDLSFESGAAATARHRIWPRIMAYADARWGGAAFAEPDPSAFRVIQADIPDVRGKTLEEARGILEGAGFGFDDAGPQDSELPAGQVSSTNPTGTAPKGSVVSVHTSNGALVLLPGVIGLSEQAARAALAGFAVQVRVVAVTDKALDGKVTESNPAPGTPIRPGAAVEITVGRSG